MVIFRYVQVEPKHFNVVQKTQSGNIYIQCVDDVYTPIRFYGSGPKNVLKRCPYFLNQFYKNALRTFKLNIRDTI